jgi:hypothetical protein
MSMRRIDLNDPIVATVTIIGDAVDPADDNLDVHAHLRKGRVIGFTVFTLRNIERLMSADQLAWFVSPGMLIVYRLTDDAIVGAIRDGVSLGLGVVQRED